MIARVFPRKTNASPTDALAFFREPTIENISDCIKHGVSEVHISVTFTWDLERAEELYDTWQILGVPVEVGGPAFDDRMGDFTPGLYLREGMIFTSRGCIKDCWFCSVPRCAHGEIRELPIVDGWNILDDNILGTSEAHFRAVCDMLKRQTHKAVFTGGLEPALLQQWQADLLHEVKPARLYTAYDTKDDLEPLMEMVKIRLQKQLPVFPEFQLTPGVVYPAEKYQSCHDGRATYIVTLDADHRTLVRQEECEEVLSDEQ